MTRKDKINKRTVLVVDDEANIRLLVKSMLKSNCIVLEARDGQEAVDIARQKMPDVILMDIMMPNMDGYTACYTLKNDQATKHIPVVMLTALGKQLNQRLADDMGANGYMTKPFTPPDLVDTINKY